MQTLLHYRSEFHKKLNRTAAQKKGPQMQNRLLNFHETRRRFVNQGNGLTLGVRSLLVLHKTDSLKIEKTLPICNQLPF